MLHTGGGSGKTPPPPPHTHTHTHTHMIVKRFGCIAINSKALYICIIHSFILCFVGAKLTATDLPETLGNLRCNLNRNTRWHWRHEPQVTALRWGYKLEETFPRSTHYYDYVLAADVVHPHYCLAELLDTMHHFCQTGTTLIFANKVRYQSDLVFMENFQKAFNTTLLTELDEVKIYSASLRF